METLRWRAQIFMQQAFGNVFEGQTQAGIMSLHAYQVGYFSRRAGIEPLIGHIKQGGQMRKSRMKSDFSTEGAGYLSVFGFNLRQLMRNITRQVRPGGDNAGINSTVFNDRALA